MKKKKHSKVLIIILSIVLVIFIALGVTAYILYGMITNTQNKDKFGAEPSTNIVTPLLQSILFGSEQEITDDDINGIIADVIKINNETSSTATDSASQTQPTAETAAANQPSSDMTIKNAAIYCDSDNKCSVYIDIDYKNIEMILSAQAAVTLNDDKTLSFTLTNTKLGTLEIPPQWILAQMQDTSAFDAISDDITVANDSIIVPSSYSLEFMDTKFTIELTKLKLKSGKANVQTTSAMDEITQLIEKYLSENISW